MTFASLSQGLRRDTAPVHFPGFIYRDYIPSVYQTCTPDDASHVRTFGATAPARNKHCTMPTFAKASAGKDGKNTRHTWLVPGLLPAKTPGPYRWTSGNMPPLQSGSSLSRHTMSGLNARPSLLTGR